MTIWHRPDNNFDAWQARVPIATDAHGRWMPQDMIRLWGTNGNTSYIDTIRVRRYAAVAPTCLVQ